MTTLRTLLLVPALALATGIHATPAAAQRSTADTDAVAAIDSILQTIFPASGPGAAVLVARDGRVLLRKGYGMADVEMGVPIRPEHVFRIGSVTKQFTAVAILKLVEEGKLSLDDDLSEHLPDFPTGGRRITIEQLLTHTSGIRSYTGIPEWRPLVRNDLSLDELIDVFENQPADFEPGEKWSYNNSAYVLLGAIVEKISGQSYADFVRTQLFEPIGMTASYYGDERTIIPNRVEGYGRDAAGTIHNAEYMSMTQPYAAGSILSTVDDLHRWNAALAEGKVVKPETLRRAFTPVRLNDGGDTGYGYGWFIGEAAGRPTVEHGGDIFGFASDLFTVPSERLTVVVLANGERDIADPGEASLKIAERLLGPAPEPARLSLSTEALDEYIGNYKVGDRDFRVVTREGDRLYSQRSRQERLEIVPIAKDRFVFPGSGTRVTFRRGSDGRVTAMATRGRLGPEQLVPRTDESADIQPAVVEVPTAVLASYQGSYQLGPNFALVVTLEEGTLKARATGQPDVTLLPESATRFNLKELPAAVEFELDAAGIPVALILHQGGRAMRAERVK